DENNKNNTENSNTVIENDENNKNNTENSNTVIENDENNKNNTENSNTVIENDENNKNNTENSNRNVKLNNTIASPKTGDNKTSLYVFIVLAIISISGFAVMIITKKHR
ncbi:MAG: LPXTG cell wall anchor domain-containing protein, partial [Clostridiales bacterium]|nr:LPXTG cell wall anchor domain-containing protein [Clostridiales bacterium]